MPEKKLGKLSLAILENFVEGTLGKTFVEELKSPTQRFLAIQTALAHTETRFKKEFEDKDLAQAIFVDLPIDKSELGKAIGVFFDHPTNSDFSKTLENILTSEFKNLPKERTKKAADFYINLLKRELALADETFREKVRALADLDTLEHLKNLGDELSTQRKSKTVKDKKSDVQVILNGKFSEFNEGKREDFVGALALMLQVEKESISILHVISGSVILEIEMDQGAANRFLKLFINNDPELNKLDIISVKIITKNKTKPKKSSNKVSGDINITIQGDVIGSNLMAGNQNQSTINPKKVTNEKAIASYIPTDIIPPVGDLPLGSYLPFSPNPLFTGRVDDLKKLADSLLGDSKTGTVITQAVTGMGGLGKTQLSVEFAYRYGKYFQGVHWMNLAEPTSFDAEIANCGREMNLPNFPADQPSQVILTLQTWKEDGPRLLILDNFEEVKLANDILPKLRHSNLRILITSRRSDWPVTTGLSPIPLGLFSKEESLEFLKHALTKRKDSEQELNNLADRLGHLPLGLELASRYLNVNLRLKMVDYLQQTEQALEHISMKGWREDLPAPTAHDLDLQRTFALSWQAINNETAQKIFLVAGYLASNTPIPLELFEQVLEVSSRVCDENLSILYGLGLLRQNETLLPNSESQILLPSIHPLLAEYARGLKSGENNNLLINLSEELSRLARQANDKIDQTGKLHWFIPLYPHILSTINFAERAKIENVANLLGNLGYYLQIIADYQGAKSAKERSLKIKEAILGLEHQDIAVFCNNLGGVMKVLGDLNGARTIYERALKIDEANFGANHLNVARDVNNLAMVMQDLGDLNGARNMFERALKISETNLGADHLNIAIVINNLARVMQDLGDLNGARNMFERALKISETHLSADHPNLAIIINNLGTVMKELGDLNGARNMYERALKIFETNLGADHPNVAVNVNNLGDVMQELGDLNGARVMFQHALKIREKAFGNEHPEVAQSLWWLGVIERDEGNKENARDYVQRALNIYKKFLPPEHPTIKSVQKYLDSLNKS